MTKEERWVLEEKYGVSASRDLRSPYIEAFAEDCRRLAAGEPAAYIIGHQPFLGLKTFLESRPLIPRPETEWWAEKLLQSISQEPAKACSPRGLRSAAARGLSDFPAGKSRTPKGTCRAGKRDQTSSRQLRFLDLCAGSGAIGCAALARLPGARVYFGELEAAHGATIQKNIRANGLDESRADIRIGDLFEPFSDMRFDFIAANPPYIPEGRVLPASVARYEPPAALFAGPDGLALIRRIARALPTHLAPGGIAWIECDSAHAQEARAITERAGLRASIIPDQYGAPRVIAVSLP